MPKQKISSDQIIIESLRIFRQKSYYNTSMEDIATACGLLKGSLYHHFRSKEDLMHRCIQTVHAYFKEEVFSPAYNTALNPVQRMKKLVAKAEDIFIHRENGCIMGNVGVETAIVIPEFAEIIQNFFKDFFNALKEIYLLKFERKEALELAERSVAEVEGSIMLARIFNDKKYLKNTHKRLVTRLKNA